MDSLVRSLLSQPPLDAERERDLARRARAGDRSARDELVRAGLRLVALRARSRGAVGEALDEAVQAGTIGLIAAVDRFDPDRGCRLATYAWPWITASMRPPLVREAPSARLPETAVAEVVPTADDLGPEVATLPPRQAEVLRLRYRLGEAPGPLRTRCAVAERLGITPTQVRSEESRAMRHLRRRLARVGPRAPRAGADPL